ncbi:mechanosensitive ion channel family protein [Halofilum ochraceum]|uniref:mechanosensitive ion channel family protein n=1 Tax=Halofilum ochraceum TaxID=1611323 RepID=UPI0008DA974D|nr:mechanosensitive ion channel family protein [Halofilum ochraceum]
MNTSPEQLWAEFGPIITDLSINVISALVLIIVGWSIAGWAHRAVRRGLGRFKDMDRTLISVVAGVTRYFILITLLVMVLGRFGVQTASILAALGAAGLAVGLALQGTLANIAAGVMLLVLRPFRIGDYVNANGNEGTVEEVGLFSTEFTTYDGLYVSVPNSGIWGGRILNYSRNPNRRHDIVVGISYRDDIDRAQEILLGVIRNDPRVLSEPAEPQVLVRELADSSVNLGMRFWTTGDDFWPASFELRKAAKKALDEAGITIPFPQRDVHHFDHREVA